jgi:hypothetical protein
LSTKCSVSACRARRDMATGRSARNALFRAGVASRASCCRFGVAQEPRLCYKNPLHRGCCLQAAPTSLDRYPLRSSPPWGGGMREGAWGADRTGRPGMCPARRPGARGRMARQRLWCRWLGPGSALMDGCRPGLVNSPDHRPPRVSLYPDDRSRNAGVGADLGGYRCLPPMVRP